MFEDQISGIEADN